MWVKEGDYPKTWGSSYIDRSLVTLFIMWKKKKKESCWSSWRCVAQGYEECCTVISSSTWKVDNALVEEIEQLLSEQRQKKRVSVFIQQRSVWGESHGVRFCLSTSCPFLPYRGSHLVCSLGTPSCRRIWCDKDQALKQKHSFTSCTSVPLLSIMNMPHVLTWGRLNKYSQHA